MTAPERATRTAEADALCVAAYDDNGGPETGAALVAVGGYGRGELAPHSDLDVVLVSDEGVDLGDLAEKVWYPLWDSGSKLDHSVRTLPEMIAAADADVRVASGLLDLRHLAGDPNLTLRLRTTMLAAWRRGARDRLPALHDMVRSRHRLIGELAHLSVPDLKEAEGGLRDATVLRGLVATWLVDVPHVDLERSRLALLDVRDLVQAMAGRATDRVTPEMWAELATALGLDDELSAQVHVRELGRRITHLSRLAWRRVDAVLARPVSVKGARRPSLEPLAPSVALSSGEVVLDRKARPADDPLLLLRAATAAAERDVVLAPATAARLVRECPPLPEPWPAEARQLLVRLLASGRSLLGVWETLEETGALSGFLPEWERVRMLPHASVIHRFTVDRHVIETCIEASALIRSVRRPDVLMVAALLHDIGKGGLTEHSVAGEPIARSIATRMGFEPECVDLIALLVRWHLLLAQTATTRDPDDPATVDLVTSRLGSVEAVALLGALTEADAKATSTKAWSSWRSGLVRDLARRAHAALDTGTALPPVLSDDVALPADFPAALKADGVYVSVEPAPDGSRVTTIAVDRIGLLADFAAMFALQRTGVRAARAWSQGDYGVSVWEVSEEHLDPAILRQKYDGIVAGRLDPSHRLRPTGDGLAPTVVVRPEASDHSTVLEVRTGDRPGVVYLVCAALARLDVEVRSAHVDTLGPQAVDVFYLQEPSAGVLSETRSAQAAHAVREALTGPG
ncbi:bifunctional uridylyltransferase/uridylyl-removing enzyme [Nocardioides szechwanensis]|uniref:Bifunctional uridylyltransferase/uridylyl-removing enzyme n=1 Tax=Nocardioides szechwanensis TaxID=1005944 RepID=A0A1G9UT22_9ACTN|nr:[protein-PII] uridylyltransferase [Nocardioides szechwanensis]GEP33153.1 bifunctional uridylyltransferase/uridylyl-removing enzyme [Nocardioides szechwanensis]SDM63046.1 UTP--GlnB (protein PII) uridylyltransferase, GlnD [Nocardioides szechwanensis]